jgi:hypothetical protein
MARACHALGKHSKLERLAVNALRLLSALFGRPVVRGDAQAFRTLLPPLLRPLLDLLRPVGYVSQLCDPAVSVSFHGMPWSGACYIHGLCCLALSCVTDRACRACYSSDRAKPCLLPESLGHVEVISALARHARDARRSFGVPLPIQQSIGSLSILGTYPASVRWDCSDVQVSRDHLMPNLLFVTTGP